VIGTVGLFCEECFNAVAGLKKTRKKHLDDKVLLASPKAGLFTPSLIVSRKEGGGKVRFLKNRLLGFSLLLFSRYT
jgi:hypothetical protein